MAAFEKQAEEIEALIKDSGLSRDEIALKLGMEPDTLRKYAKGYQKASDRTLLALHVLVENLIIEKVGIRPKRSAVVQEATARYGKDAGDLKDEELREIVRVFTTGLSVPHLAGLIPEVQGARIEVAVRERVIGFLAREIGERTKEKL